MFGYGLLSGLAGSVTPATVDALRAKYGDGKVANVNEMSELMALVGEYLKPDSWEYCTINAYLNGTPSEDDLSYKAKYFSEMPTLEEVCGDHSYGDQYGAAFAALDKGGAPTEFTDWLKVKGKALLVQKTEKAKKDGSTNFNKGVKDAMQSVNPLSNPVIVGLLLAAIVAWAYAKGRK